MFTIRNLGGVALFLFGTTFMWMTPIFARSPASARGVLWSMIMALSLLTMVGFTIATWGLFTKATWWTAVAVASAIAGVVALIPYWIAAHAIGEPTPWYNVLVHAVGAAAILVLLLVQPLGAWVNGHVMAGR
jgi:hypothetical protein